MSIADLGSLGEFFGSIAVLITLVYLALQVRHSKELLLKNEKISLSQVYQARVDSRREIEKLVIDDSIAKILLKSGILNSEKSEELTELEKMRIRTLHSLWIDWWDNNIFQESLGLLNTKDLLVDTKQFGMLINLWDHHQLHVPPRVREWYKDQMEPNA